MPKSPMCYSPFKFSVSPYNLAYATHMFLPADCSVFFTSKNVMNNVKIKYIEST